jgi:hypothetical protein
MTKKLPEILSLTAAIAALSGVTALSPTPAAANTPTTDRTDATQKGQAPKGEPNVFMSVGSDLLGLIVTTAADGTVLAQHYSHYSHSSHSSHSSHYSSR